MPLASSVKAPSYQCHTDDQTSASELFVTVSDSKCAVPKNAKNEMTHLFCMYAAEPGAINANT